MKLAGKKRMFGYDVKPNRTLVHLPKRPEITDEKR